MRAAIFYKCPKNNCSTTNIYHNSEANFGDSSQYFQKSVFCDVTQVATSAINFPMLLQAYFSSFYSKVLDNLKSK